MACFIGGVAHEVNHQSLAVDPSTMQRNCHKEKGHDRNGTWYVYKLPFRAVVLSFLVYFDEDHLALLKDQARSW